MKRLLVGLCLWTAINAVASDETSPLVFHPEISPDGQTLAFTYQGDIWSMATNGQKASRLTIHEGYESHPAWSRDGKNLAFSSDRFGNRDVFIMPAEGGRPQRLTFHSASDVVSSFTPDNHVLFNSRRLYAQVEREWEVMAVNAQGNDTEFRYMDALGFQAVVSPDGNKIAFVRGTCRIEREDYRGPANRDIWVYHIDEDRYQQVTRFTGNDFMPRWSGNDELYYVSSRAGKYNVFKQRLSGDAQQISHQKDFGVEHYSISENANTLVYQAADSVYLSQNSGEISPFSMHLATDFRFDPVTAKTETNNLDAYALSPNGKLSAYVLRGDIYVTRNDKDDKRSVKLTTGAARDRDVAWLNDETLLFVSDRNGQNDMFTLVSADSDQTNLFLSLKHQIRPLTQSEAQERLAAIAPNGKRIAYTQDRGKLLTADVNDALELKNVRVLVDGWATPRGTSWSPDSNWLAYSLSDLSFNEEVYIHAADNSAKPVNVSMHPRYDSDPVWSPDGSKLGFVSMRNNGDDDIWFAWLKESDWQRSKEEWERLAKADKPEKGDTPENGEQGADEDENAEHTEEPETMEIDLDGIYKRLVQVTRMAGNESELAFDDTGEHIYFGIGGAGRQNFKVEQNLYKIKWNGDDQKTIIKGNKNPQDLVLSEDGKFLYALSGNGVLMQVDTAKDKAETLAVNSQQVIEHLAERAQIFDEAWQALNEGFYDPDFHGKDWAALKARYRPLALKASTKEDFQYIFNLMLGQVNASHMGMYRGDNQKQTQKATTGLLGAELMPLNDGLRVNRVLPNSPAARADSELQINDVIVSVNQQAVADVNLYSLLNNQSDQPVLLGIRRGGEAQEVVIWPTSSLRDQLYDDWVEERRKLTERYSDGKLGYLHIRGMNWSSFERFERELMAAGYGKQGIVIDVRYNGGGWTTDYLLAVLNVKQHAYTIPRGAADDLATEHTRFTQSYPFSERLPLSAWTKPSVAMSNENSYSNAEIFSHAYKSLGIGKLVGRPTFGAVISTGAQRLVDGSIVRMPFRGWWVKATGKNMDFTPAVPDIEVFNPPAYKASGVDPQLQRAVEELLQTL